MSGVWLKKLWHIHMTKDYVITKMCKQTIYQDMKRAEHKQTGSEYNVMVETEISDFLPSALNF